jgi:hypothetical protein
MISMEFVEGPYNTRGVKTGAPFELVGYFLTTEATGPRSWPFTLLLPALERVREGKENGLEMAGNAHRVYLRSHSVRLEEEEEVVGRQPLTCDITLEDFNTALLQWRDQLLAPT